MTTEEYLRQALWTERQIKEIREEIQRLRELASSVSGTAGERTGGTGLGDRVGHAAAEIVYLEDMLAEEIKLYTEQYREITEAIKKVDDARYREILRRRYIKGQTYSSIACDMHYSTQNIWRLHKRAIACMDDVLHER